MLAVFLAVSLALLGAGKTILSHRAPADKVAGDPAALDPELAAAAAVMVAPPFGTPLTLMADPRQLRAITIRGVAAYESATKEDAQIKAARMIQVAAALGYGPARDLILANFTSARLMRSAVPAPDVVRYAMDGFAVGAVGSKGPSQTFLPLARYYGQRGELETFATHVVETIRDDARLQKGKVLDRILEALSLVPGACQSVARAISAPRSEDHGRCAVALKVRLLTHIRSAGPIYRDDFARRQALGLIAKLGDTPVSNQANNAETTMRVIPGFVSQAPADQSSGTR
jgi:hypothetical protein